MHGSEVCETISMFLHMRGTNVLSFNGTNVLSYKRSLQHNIHDVWLQEMCVCSVSITIE